MNNKYQNNSPTNYNNTHISDYNNLYRSNPPAKKENKKLTLKTIKNNTISSLNDVEHFLNNFQRAIRYIKIYKLFK